MPKDLLIKVKHLAIDKNTSVSGLLYKTLEELVNKQYAYEKAKKHHLKNMPQEQHECDLFLLSSHSPYYTDYSLSDFARLGRRNIDGWGIGYYMGREAKVIRSELPAMSEG